MSAIPASRLPVIFRSCSRIQSVQAFRFVSELNKNVENAGEKKEPAKVYEKPLYATKYSFDAEVRSNRESRQADHTNGYKVTSFQKWMLVITRLYSSPSSVPEYVPTQTMQRLHDRNRVVFIVVAILLFFTFFLSMEYSTGRKIERDRAAGKVVTRMA